MNIRHHFSWDRPYYEINREERYYCAIMYHLLLTNDNLRRFLELVSINRDHPDCAVYVEYSQLRDIWHEQNGNNKAKRAYILDALDYDRDHGLRACPKEEFNRYFGAVPKPSGTDIQSPSNWSLPKFNAEIKNDKERLRTVAIFKWCFNAKPDIVIHLRDEEAICIEAKVESSENKYPSSSADRESWDKCGLERVTQREIQERVFQLLGIKCHFVFLTKTKSGNDRDDAWKKITWEEVFEKLCLNGVHSFITSSIKQSFGSSCSSQGLKCPGSIVA